MTTNLAAAVTDRSINSGKREPALSEGQYFPTADNAKPGLIVTAYVVDDRDDLFEDRDPIRGYVARREISIYREAETEGEVEEGKEAGQQDDHKQHEKQEDANKEEGADAQSGDIIGNVFLQPFIVARVFFTHYQSMRLTTLSMQGVQKLRTSSNWSGMYGGAKLQRPCTAWLGWEYLTIL